MIRSILTVFLSVVVTMNNINPTQGLSGSRFFCRQRNSVVSATRRMMMMDETIITITKTNKNINSNTASTKQQQHQAKTDSTLATLYRQEMIDLEYEIFFLEEDIMHIVHERKELMQQRCQ